MPKLKIDTIMPTPEEDAAITAAALSDPDCPPLTDEQFKQLRPMRGRPLVSGVKTQLTVRFDTKVIEAFRQSGEGWQTRMNYVLKDWLMTHQVTQA